MTGRVHVIGAATSAGAHGPGQEAAPGAFRRYGLLDGMAEAGLEVVDHGDVVSARMRPDPNHPRVADVDRVIEAARAVSRNVQQVLETDPHGRILVLGGDCTIQLGVIAGAKAARGDSLALAYIDLDCDLTSPVNGNGIADWMGVTHLLDAPDAYPPLSGIDGRSPLLTADQLRLVGADRATPYEQERLRDLGLIRYTSQQVSVNTADIVAEISAWTDDVSLLSVHVDVDVLDQTAFPIAEEQRDVPGLSLDTLARLVSALMEHPMAHVLTVTEVNPTRPPDPAAAFGALNALLIGSLTH